MINRVFQLIKISRKLSTSGAIDTINDLPTLCENNFIVRVQGTKTTRLDDYYVKFETSNGTNLLLASL